MTAVSSSSATSRCCSRHSSTTVRRSPTDIGAPPSMFGVQKNGPENHSKPTRLAASRCSWVLTPVASASVLR